MRKTKLISTVKKLPTELELDVLLEKLVFIEKVEKGIKQAKSNKTIIHEKVKEAVKKW